jgi:hypothetical protein
VDICAHYLTMGEVEQNLIATVLAALSGHASKL